jgi:crossover junction endodeoxyribonuclease RusA
MPALIPPSRGSENRPQALLSVVLPLPPSINEQYATVNGHRISTVVARRFKQQVHKILKTSERQRLLNEALRLTLQQNYLALSLNFYFNTPHRCDLDGGLKITQDALCTYLGLNDNRVVDIHLTKLYRPHPSSSLR